jgi:hypothetical protein
MGSFPYVIKYKKGQVNVVADALSRRFALISVLNARLMGFEQVKEQYANDSYLLMWLPNVQRELVMGSLCMKVTCSKWVECVFLQVRYRSCLCERLMVVVLVVILGRRRLMSY